MEGQTEQVFVERLVREIAEGKRFQIEIRRGHGGKKYPRTFTTINFSTTICFPRYYILIVDSGSDGRVASDIRNDYSGLSVQGYSRIIAMRDVYPQFTYSQADRLKRGMEATIAAKPNLPVDVVLCTMEIEAWFLGEHSHFLTLNPKLTIPHIIGVVGFDPSAYDVETRPHPTDDIELIYASGGLSYLKDLTSVTRTVSALDFDIVQSSLGSRVQSLGQLTSTINRFIS